VEDPPVVETDFRPGSGARFVYSPEAVTEVLTAMETIYDLFPTEFLATARPAEIAAKLLQAGFKTNPAADRKYGDAYEGKLIPLSDGTMLRISVIVTPRDVVKVDFRVYYRAA
jgi:hypothetical protein